MFADLQVADGLLLTAWGSGLPDQVPDYDSKNEDGIFGQIRHKVHRSVDFVRPDLSATAQSAAEDDRQFRVAFHEC